MNRAPRVMPPRRCFKSYWALCSSLMHTSDSTVIQSFSGLPRLSMAKTLSLSMKLFGSNIPILVDQLLGTKTVPPNGTTLISMKVRMASILWRNSMAAMPPMGYGLSQGRTTHALTYRDFTKTLDQIDSLTPSRCSASLAMSRSATGKPCMGALPTPLQTLGHLQLWLPPAILCSRCCGQRYP